MQNAIALGIVVLAAVYLAYHAWRFVSSRGRAGCSGGCRACPEPDESNAPLQLVRPEEITTTRRPPIR